MIVLNNADVVSRGKTEYGSLLFLHVTYQLEPNGK